MATTESHPPHDATILRPKWPLALWLAHLAVPAALIGHASAALSRTGASGVARWAVLAVCTAWLILGLALAALPRGRRWLVGVRWQLLLGCASLAISLLVVGESAVRMLSWRDVDGNRKFRTIVLKPLHLPLASTQQEIDRYLESSASTTIYDPDLGWAPRPRQASQWYAYNAAAIRVASPDHEFDPQPPPGNWRVALFGDSFTQGAEVEFADSWGAKLEQDLTAGGHPSEVLNFGVGGYGMDQALLRWQKQGRPLLPQIVVFGFQPENIDRNANLIRRLYQINSGNPLSKPRFILTPTGLQLLNRPCLPPEKLVETLRSLDRWELVRYEEYYRPGDYAPHLWQRSLLLQVVVELATRETGLEPARFALARPRIALALEIIRAFDREVRAAGSRFVVVHLPNSDHLAAMREQGALPYADLLAAIGRDVTLVRTEAALLDLANELPAEAMFRPAGHYGPQANALVARRVAETLIEPAAPAK